MCDALCMHHISSELQALQNDYLNHHEKIYEDVHWALNLWHDPIATTEELDLFHIVYVIPWSDSQSFQSYTRFIAAECVLQSTFF